jgi:dTDP-4-dehydrorhamnose 3,5-epimerase
MLVEKTSLPGVVVVTPRRHQDARGYFEETYNHRTLTEAGIAAQFVQDNQAFSRARGTIRGLHFQIPPFAQGKLVRVLRGRIMDVAVDIRRGSPTYGQSVAVELSAANGRQIWVPPGFAHGYCTLEPDSEVFYKVDNYYAPKHEGGIRWNDPVLGIDWGVSADEVLVSDKDAVLPTLAEFGESPFSA